MGTYAEFSIQGIEPDLSKQTIVVKTNFKVDPNSVSKSTVSYYCYDTNLLEVYQLRVDGKNIYIDFENYPDNNSRYYLKVSNIKDALGRTLKTSCDSYIKFEKDIQTKVKILAPVSRQTLKSRLVDIRIQAIDPIENLTYRIELATDNIFYNKIGTLLCTVPNEYYNNQNEQVPLEGDNLKTENDSTKINEGYFYNNEVQLSTMIEREGQIYIRARAELEDNIAGDWTDILSFNIYTISMDSIETNFLEDYLTTDDLFDDSIDLIEPPSINSKSPSASNDGMFYVEFDGPIKLPEEIVYDENGYVILDSIIGFRKNLEGKGKKEKVTFNMVVDEDDLETVLFFPINSGELIGEVLNDSTYDFNIKNLKFEDGSVYSNKESFITAPSEYYYVPLEDVKEIAGKLRVPDIDIIRNIMEASKTAHYWAKRKVENTNQMPDFNNVDLQEDYYPFYMFIKYHAISESLKARYVEMIANPFKWHDVLSDLEREEEWDLDAIKALINDYDKEADEWLELIVTITADPKWALRGKYCYTTFYTGSNPYHRIQWGYPPHNDFKRGY